jgi:ribulose 1,5-bisphosphate synthetase/thiazole synthase
MDDYFSLFEIVEHLVDHIMVKRSQIVASGHHANFVAHSSQKASNLDCNVSSPNHQSLSGRGLPMKNVITSNC